jgi:putative endonuclease
LAGLLGEPEHRALPLIRQGFFMTFWVYIIQSESSGRYYCGQSTDVERRLRQHNDPEYQLSKTTKRIEGPWKLIWSRGCSDRSEATQLERKIKKREARWGRPCNNAFYFDFESAMIEACQGNHE